MLRTFLTHFKNTIKKSSYDLQNQFSNYKLQRKSQIQKSFKQFNLRPPTEQILTDEVPKIYRVDLPSLKQYSHKYPLFLQKELKNKESKIFSQMQSLINKMFLMKTEEGLQFILFLDSWKFLNKQQKQMISRWVSNQDLSFDQIWVLLKSTLQLQNLLQNKIIKHLEQIQPKQYSYLFKALNYYRLKQTGSQTFFYVTQKHILKHIELMTGSQLTQVVSHYCNNPSENIQSRTIIMETVANRMKIILKHLSAAELLTVLFCYLKIDMFKEEMADSIVNVIVETLPKWGVQEIRQLIQLSTNMQNKQQPIIRQLIKIFNNNKLHSKLIPALYSMAIQYTVLDEEFIRRIEAKLLQQIHNMSPQNVSKSCWAVAVVPRKSNPLDSIPMHIKIYNRIQQIIQGGLKDYTIKDVTRIVWSLGIKQYKLKDHFWNNVQSWLQEQLSKNDKVILRDVSLILWAYTNQLPLKYSTIQMIKNIINQRIDQCEGFDVAMICWFFSQINQSNSQLMNKMYQKFKDLIDQMQLAQVIKSLRWFISQREVDDSLLTQFVKRVDLQYKQKPVYTLVNCLSILTSIKIQNKELLIITVINVHKQIQALKQIQQKM